MDSIEAKFDELALFMRKNKNYDQDEGDSSVAGERVDQILESLKQDFNQESKLKSEADALLQKCEALKVEKSPIGEGWSSRSLLPSLKRQSNLAAVLAEKEEQITQYEQKVEILHVELNTCELISKEAVEGSRRAYKKARGRERVSSSRLLALFWSFQSLLDKEID